LDTAYILNFILGSVLVPLFGIIAYKLGILDTMGVAVSLVVGMIIFWYGGWTWFIEIFYFLTAASLFTRFKYNVKYSQNIANAGGEIRTWSNVAANGAAATLASVLYGITTQPIWYAFFIGSVSAVAADTLATEVGLTSTKQPRLITDLKKMIPAGTSGGVTLMGEVAALLAAAMAGIVGFLGASIFEWSYFKVFLLSLVGGFLGANIDSLLGATVQGVYRCRFCGKVTEKKHHCGRRSILQRGSSIINNDFVNLIASVVGGSVAVALFFSF